MTITPLEQKKTGFLNMPKLPVAGFFQRLLAFLIDLVLIIMGIHLVSKALPGFFFSLGEASPYFTALITFLYFAGFNGPLGGGRTIGKIILWIQTTDYDGNVPTWRQAVIRTVILMPVFVTAPLANVILGSIGSTMESYIHQLFVGYAFFAVLVATAIIIPFNPFKQGFHDFLAQTLVRPRTKEQPPSFEEMAATVGPAWKTFHRQPQYSGLITFVMVFSLLGFLGYQGYFSFPARRAYQDSVYALQTDVNIRNVSIGPVPMHPVDYFANPDDLTVEEYKAHIRSLDEETTAPLSLILRVSRSSRWPYDPTAEEFRPYMESIAVRYHEECLPLLINAYATQQEQAPEREEGLLDIIGLRIKNWPRRPIHYSLHFETAISLLPHIIPLEESAGILEVKLPPLQP